MVIHKSLITDCNLDLQQVLVLLTLAAKIFKFIPLTNKLGEKVHPVMVSFSTVWKLIVKPEDRNHSLVSPN